MFRQPSAEMLLGHWDGYAGNRNNFFVYQNPKTDRVEFLPWGTDQSFGTHQFLSTAPPRIVRARGRLCAALYVSPTYRQRYLTTVHEMLQNWWDAPALLADVEQAAELIRPHILLRQEKFDQALATLRRYIEGTSPEITAELETPPDKWLVALPEDPTPSTEAEPAWAGTVKSTFSIPFTRYEMRDFTVLKSNALEIVWRDRPVNHPVAIGKLGYEHADPLWFETPTLLLLLHSPPDGRNVWISMKLDPDLLAKGGNIRLHKSQVTAWFGTSISGRNESINHGLLDGVLKAELVKINGTNTLNGVIDARLYSGRKELEF